ncbi:MAG TPA: glycosyltransferase family A protein [Verrucomicrobiae bacterium]|jgi:glycosyltransferase involved in cell wall biosynthesis|nr:glycosyltransferase family A protein [Verrucomicrobiae bacterium]
MDKLVSVVIPVYNGEKYLAEAVESVLKQTYRPIEIIVVDDGSTDASRQIAGSFGSSVSCHCQTRAGAAAARNRGVELSSGSYLAFLDADDLWMVNKLARQFELVMEDRAIDLVFTHVRHFHSPELPDEVKRKIQCPPEPMPGYAPTTVLVTRDAFLRTGPFETSLRVGEFIDWYARAQESGIKSAIVPESLALRRLHTANQSLVQHDAQTDYARVVKAALDRRRGRM